MWPPQGGCAGSPHASADPQSHVAQPAKRIAELGKIYKTLFLYEYLQGTELQREIHEELNAVESWNSTNTFIF
ncbi:transposase [Candidatus Gracilibacteria bacterium]|nr:transposase [Candidatus Gracilibacteria bacterium]